MGKSMLKQPWRFRKFAPVLEHTGLQTECVCPQCGILQPIEKFRYGITRCNTCHIAIVKGLAETMKRTLSLKEQLQKAKREQWLKEHPHYHRDRMRRIREVARVKAWKFKGEPTPFKMPVDWSKIL